MKPPPGSGTDLVARLAGAVGRVEARHAHQTGLWRRRAVIATAHRCAARDGASITLTVAPDAEVSPRARWRFQRGTHTTVEIGHRVELQPGAILQLSGGRLTIGPEVQVRTGAVLSTSGVLHLTRGNVISYGAMIHCSGEVTLGAFASLSERSTVVDSTHYYSEPLEHYWHNTVAGSVTLGVNTWVCPGAVITRNVELGDHCIVASNSVVIADAPAGTLLSGVPATAVRTVRRPWLERARPDSQVTGPGTGGGARSE